VQQDDENQARDAARASRRDLPEVLTKAVIAELQTLMQHTPEAGLWLIATPIGHLGDIGLRALAVLALADELYCEDVRHTRTLLARYGIGRPARPYHEHNAARQRPHILASLGAGRSVAVVSDAGTPLVSDPGHKLVREVIAAGHPVHTVPGPSAVLSALLASGLPTDAFHFAGFLPAKEAARARRLAQLAQIPATLILFEAPGRLAALLETATRVLGPRPAAVARELTKRFEEIRRGSLPELASWAAATDIKGEIAVVVAPPANEAPDEAAIRASLEKALATLSLRDAAQIVADRLGAPKAAVYDLALAMRREHDRQRGDDE
jgi:16S rRNA (cytidine1402-2'-O)-methyltransferase